MIGAAHLGILAGATPRAGGGAGHRHWRLYFPNAGNQYLAFSEVEMYSAIGGPNRCGSGTVSASSVYGANAAANAFDGNTGTLWSTNVFSGAHWLAYDFGTPVDVVQFKLRNAPTNYQSPVTLQYSDDGSSWTDATPLLQPGRQVDSGSQTYLVGGVKTYWRIYVSANQSSGYTNISELEFRESVGGADVSSPGQPGRVDSAYAGTTNESHMVDNNTGNYWESANGVPHWVWYAFGREVELAELSLRTGPYAGESPKDFLIQYSGDGTNWTTAKTVTGSTGWSAWETRTFAI